MAFAVVGGSIAAALDRLRIICGICTPWFKFGCDVHVPCGLFCYSSSCLCILFLLSHSLSPAIYFLFVLIPPSGKLEWSLNADGFRYIWLCAWANLCWLQPVSWVPSLVQEHVKNEAKQIERCREMGITLLRNQRKKEMKK